jgi:hypothetical protein
MATFKFTGLGVGSAAGDSANLSQVQSTVTKLLASVSGADTVTATASPTLAAYAAGQMFYFVAAGDNTTSVTLNIDALGAKDVTRDGSVALAAADIKSGEVVVVVYDGTRFQVVSQLNSAGDATFANVSITSALNVGGVATFSGNVGIGTASPVEKLDVVGNCKISSGNSFYWGDATSQITATNSGPMLFLTGTAVERARILSGGNFIVGGTSAVEGGLFVTSFDGATVPGVVIADTSATTTANMLFFYKSGAVRGSIQTTASATAYNTSSDRRLKDNIAPADNAGSVIDAIEVVKHDWKVGGHTRYGMIAQDLHIVAPEAVSVGDDGEELKTPWGVDYSKLVPMLVKELQSLRKRVAELESK